MAEYSVRYESDGQVTRILFLVPKPEKLALMESEFDVAEPPKGLAEELKKERNTHHREIIRTAAGLLFLHDCCPGENFCVYQEDERAWPVTIEIDVGPSFGIFRGVHRYYGDDDGLWPTDESEIMDG